MARINLTGGMPLSTAYPSMNSMFIELYNAAGIGEDLTLDDLKDILIVNPVEKQFLQYDPTAGPIDPVTGNPEGRWVNSAVTINEINGIDIVGTPAQFQVLQWDGSKWVNSMMTVNELNDFTQTGTLSTFQVIQWDGTKWTNSAVNVAELGDVIVTGTPVSGQTIKWTGSNWANSKVGVGELNNVSLGTMGAGQAGQVLQWTGTNWSNSSINFNEITNSYVANTGSVGEVIKWSANAGGSGVAGYVDGFLSVDELSDVTISSLANEEVLIYNSTAGQWQNKSASLLNIPQLGYLQSAVNRQIISSIMGVL
jgi:hypothetical protein